MDTRTLALEAIANTTIDENTDTAQLAALLIAIAKTELSRPDPRAAGVAAYLAALTGEGPMVTDAPRFA